MSVDDQDNAYGKLVDFYRYHVGEYGDDVRSLVWGSRESQNLRFKIITEMVDLNNASLLDVGCGLGDLHRYLKANKIHSNYTGVDITDDMIKQCKTLHADARFFVGDICELPDENLKSNFVVASGVFNWKLDNHETLMWSTIQRMYDLASKAAVVNIMSTNAPQKKPDNYYADPKVFIEKCQSIASHVEVRQDYMVHDFSVALFKT